MNFDNKNVKYYFNIFCFYKVGIRKNYNVWKVIMVVMKCILYLL